MLCDWWEKDNLWSWDQTNYWNQWVLIFKVQTNEVDGNDSTFGFQNKNKTFQKDFFSVGRKLSNFSDLQQKKYIVNYKWTFYDQKYIEFKTLI